MGAAHRKTQPRTAAAMEVENKGWAIDGQFPSNQGHTDLTKEGAEQGEMWGQGR